MLVVAELDLDLHHARGRLVDNEGLRGVDDCDFLSRKAIFNRILKLTELG